MTGKSRHTGLESLKQPLHVFTFAFEAESKKIVTELNLKTLSQIREFSDCHFSIGLTL